MTTEQSRQPRSRPSSTWLVIVLVALVVAVVLCLVAAIVVASRRRPTDPTSGSTTLPVPLSTVAPVEVTAIPFVISGRETNVYIEYILDASGSMMELLPDGTLKRDVATEVLTARLDSFPPEVNIGLRAYGHRLDWKGQTEGSCKDIELIAPVQTGQLERIATWLQDYPAKGMTPLAESIRQAIKDFTVDPSRVNTIVLISDGMETCEGDPCTLTSELKLQGINFRLHVVGLNVDAETREQLSCIADAGEGIYRDAKTAKELNQAFVAIEEQIADGQEDADSGSPATAGDEEDGENRDQDEPISGEVYVGGIVPPAVLTDDPTVTIDTNEVIITVAEDGNTSGEQKLVFNYTRPGVDDALVYVYEDYITALEGVLTDGQGQLTGTVTHHFVSSGPGAADPQDRVVTFEVLYNVHVSGDVMNAQIISEEVENENDIFSFEARKQ